LTLMEATIGNLNPSIPDSFPSGKVYWMRFVSGIIAAVICFVCRLTVLGFLIGLLVYLFSIPASIWFFHINAPQRGKHSFYTLGVGSYIFIWLTLWFLLATCFPD
ncbi:MAG: hypothetical protein QXF26_01615, partial [Candidatus Bathyarchaeia archaeon]